MKKSGYTIKFIALFFVLFSQQVSKATPLPANPGVEQVQAFFSTYPEISKEYVFYYKTSPLTAQIFYDLGSTDSLDWEKIEAKVAVAQNKQSSLRNVSDYIFNRPSILARKAAELLESISQSNDDDLIKQLHLLATSKDLKRQSIEPLEFVDGKPNLPSPKAEEGLIFLKVNLNICLEQAFQHVYFNPSVFVRERIKSKKLRDRLETYYGELMQTEHALFFVSFMKTISSLTVLLKPTV